MKVLVVGGTQFNGLALVRELARTGHDVTILNRGQTQAVLPHGVRRLYCDRTDHVKLRETLASEEFDCVQDLCAYRPEDVSSMVEILSGRVGHYIFASSTVIYGASQVLPISEDHFLERSEIQNEYGLNKILCEDILMKAWREDRFPATIAAFSMVFGPHNIIPEREQRMFMRIATGRPVLVPGDGTTLQQIGHVHDEARALRMMMQNNLTLGRRYNITGDDYFSDEGYVDTFADVVGKQPEKIFLAPEIMDDLFSGKIKAQGKSMQAQVDIRTEDNERERRARQLFTLQRLMSRLAPHIHGWNRSVLFSVERLKKDVGWEPEYCFKGAVEQTWEWMRAEGLDQTREFD